jgi:polyisoprenoid-binding protein YceI
MKKAVFIPVAAIALFAFAVIQYNWTIDTDYAIRFSTKKADGTFSNLKGTIVYDSANLAGCKFDVNVEANTISTGNKLKDKHARGDKWLDAEQYPFIRFTSTSFAKGMGDTTIVTGTLDLHGVQQPVRIPFLFVQQGNKGIFEGSFIISRKVFGIKGSMMGGSVGDEIEVSLRVPVSRQ